MDPTTYAYVNYLGAEILQLTTDVVSRPGYRQRLNLQAFEGVLGIAVWNYFHRVDVV